MEVGDVILLPLHTTSQKLRKGLQVWPITGLREKKVPCLNIPSLELPKRQGSHGLLVRHHATFVTQLSLEPV